MNTTTSLASEATPTAHPPAPSPSTTRPSRTRRAISRTLAAFTLAAGVTLLASCNAQAPGDLGRLQSLHQNCPKDQLVNAYVTTDGSATSSAEAIINERLTAIKTVVERVAVCGGHLTVTAFATNSVTVPIYDADIQIDGSTDLARLRQVPDVVEEVMTQVTSGYEPAVAALPSGGTDVVGVYRVFGEAKALRPDMRFEAVALTDGVTNQGIVFDHSLTPDEASALADAVTVPDLSESSLSVVGIGRVAGDPLPSEFIEGMKAFYTRLCEKTQAERCLVVTDGE
ncbi:hypothetical protein [Microbacterium sp. JAI119]|uniref:hypothetical protein n=1 Tax=Microbacterium sp. JAI119 TaxID=2723062 RepID=UPI0015C7B4B5|nr:hypothetical protein [Microbacterium sp. JAI119]NYF28069.1 hypothetical protein [Microbacterium sp. JAI119]